MTTTTATEQEIESVARLACATFSKSRGFVWGDSTDFNWENVGAGARQAWLDVAKAVLNHLRTSGQG